MADQPLAIAIMHKHDPVPPLPPDVPRPVADLVYAMLAKAPDGRPETAQHVADRAESSARPAAAPATSGPITADLPVVPNFPPPDGNDFYNNGNDFYNDEPLRWFPPAPPRSAARRGRPGGLRDHRDHRRFCSPAALTPAATITTGKSAETDVYLASRSARSGSPTTASLPATTAGGGGTGTNLETASKTPTATRSAGPTSSERQSPTPTPVLAVNEHVPLCVGDKQLGDPDRVGRRPTGIAAATPSATPTPTTSRSADQVRAAGAGCRQDRGMTLRCRVVWKSARHDTAPAAR